MVTESTKEQGFKFLIENSKTCEIMEFGNKKKYKLGKVVVYTDTNLEKHPYYTIKGDDIIIQTSGLVLKVLSTAVGNRLYCSVVDLDTSISCEVPIILLRKGNITQNLFNYFCTKDTSYLMNEQIQIGNGGMVKIIKSFINDVIVIDGDREYSTNREILLSEGMISIGSTMLGRTVLQSGDKYATCVKLLGDKRILIRFENGTEKVVGIGAFSVGGCTDVTLLPSNPVPDASLIGKVVTNHLGMKAIIIGIKGKWHINCMYEDGYVFSTTYTRLVSGVFLSRPEYSKVNEYKKAGDTIFYDSVWNCYLLRLEDGGIELLGHRPDLSQYKATRKGKWLDYYYDRKSKKYVITYEKDKERFVDTQAIIE